MSTREKHMRKIVTVVLPLFLILSLTGCDTGLSGASSGNNNGVFGTIRESFKF
jgi:hypothetical protein